MNPTPTIATNTAASALLELLEHKGLHLCAMPNGDLQVWPAGFLDAYTREAIARNKSGLVALLSPASVDALQDDRHYCRDCYHLQRKGNCAMAAQGRFGAPLWYLPPTDVLTRCHLFCALPY